MLTLPATFDGARTIPSPHVTELMLGLLDLHSGDKLLEVGTGSGTQTEAFASRGAEVHSVELEPWVDPTQVVGDYIFLHSGDGRIGLPQEAPFTAIVATCGVEQIPKEWNDQLSEGGRLVAPIGDSKAQRLTLFVKRNTELIPQRIAAYVRFQMLREKPKPGKIPYQVKD
jgi:protein-L-isoaspartate(D-aspartate) O-methyltransferase